MTFLVYQSDTNPNAPMIICCDVDDSFLKPVLADLQHARSTGDSTDWRLVQALLLQQMTINMDEGVWNVTKDVRTIEKVRDYDGAVHG